MSAIRDQKDKIDELNIDQQEDLAEVQRILSEQVNRPSQVSEKDKQRRSSLMQAITERETKILEANQKLEQLETPAESSTENVEHKAEPNTSADDKIQGVSKANHEAWVKLTKLRNTHPKLVEHLDFSWKRVPSHVDQNLRDEINRLWEKSEQTRLHESREERIRFAQACSRLVSLKASHPQLVEHLSTRSAKGSIDMEFVEEVSDLWKKSQSIRTEVNLDHLEIDIEDKGESQQEAKTSKDKPKDPVVRLLDEAFDEFDKLVAKPTAKKVLDFLGKEGRLDKKTRDNIKDRVNGVIKTVKPDDKKPE